MFDTVVTWIKGLFGGKGTAQFGSANKAISGITAGDHAGVLVVGDRNTVHVAAPQKEPETPARASVRVSLALTSHPVRGIVHFLCISILNTTEKSIFIGNFLLEVIGNQNLFVPQDSITGEPQRKREVHAGDRFTFHVEASRFHEIGRPAADYLCAQVEDAVGSPYKSQTKDVQDAISSLLQDPQ